ncbi:hypothetical protein RISK_001071 [Rhodopirellula islandica]|uniref:Uncharacterized protein n=1 Tax=Rhodopirellula islandica TaxID=595434 RepID=A0A0J1BKG5_RHOIS|nr:hypothetical protein RISK_001071 [Rhodopirellula islandica]
MDLGCRNNASLGPAYDCSSVLTCQQPLTKTQRQVEPGLRGGWIAKRQFAIAS